MTLTCGSWSEGHHDLYFTVQWFCLISWRLFDIWTPYFGIMSQYDSTFDLKINVGHCDLYHGPVILSYILKTIWYMNTILWDYESVWPDVWPKNVVQWFYLISWRLFDISTPYFGIMSQYDLMFDLKINVGHCDLYFMVQWFCLISWRLFDIWTPYFGIMIQYDPMFDLKINVGHCDLYFMVQWFCLISWRLFDIWTPYFGIMSQYDLMFDLKINVGHCDLYFIVHWFCLISLYLIDECHTFGKWVHVIRSSDLSFFNVCSEKYFSFIGKARFRRATLSCDSSYWYCCLHPVTS